MGRKHSGIAWFTLVLLAALAPSSSGRADVSQVRIAQGFGIPYLPLTVMRTEKLVEKKAAALGLGEVKVEWHRFGAGNVMNEALLAGQLDFAAGGVAPLLQIWDKTKGSYEVRGVASLGSQPVYLNSRNPKVKSITDFTAADKIAIPGIEVSIQAILLQMASAKAYGIEKYRQLDSLTVAMKHPEGMAALLSGTEVTAHFANSPFQEQELENEKIHRVVTSYEIVGEPTTLNSLYATGKFHDANPKVYQAVLSALEEAVEIINRDKAAAARLYVTDEKSTLTVEFIKKIMDDPDYIITTKPQGILKYAEFMHQIKKIKNLPTSWKDVYFGEIHKYDKP